MNRPQNICTCFNMHVICIKIDFSLDISIIHQCSLSVICQSLTAGCQVPNCNQLIDTDLHQRSLRLSLKILYKKKTIKIGLEYFVVTFECQQKKVSWKCKHFPVEDHTCKNIVTTQIDFKRFLLKVVTKFNQSLMRREGNYVWGKLEK